MVTGWLEGVGPTHVKGSGTERLQHSDVVETFCLRGGEMPGSTTTSFHGTPSTTHTGHTAHCRAQSQQGTCQHSLPDDHPHCALTVSSHRGPQMHSTFQHQLGLPATVRAGSLRYQSAPGQTSICKWPERFCLCSIHRLAVRCHMDFTAGTNLYPANSWLKRNGS